MTVSINVYSSLWGPQVSIDDEETGTGYRIAGPKFRDDSKLDYRIALKEGDIAEIRRYLNIAAARLRKAKCVTSSPSRTPTTTTPTS